MTNSTITTKFFAVTDAKTKTEILENIATHYGISAQEALEEVMDEDAEHLLDYVTGSTRTAVSVLMRRHSL